METVTLKTDTSVTLEQLVKFINLANQWLRRKPEHPKTKFGYAITRMLPVASKLIKPLNKLQDERDQSIEALKLKYCYSNPNTKVLEYDLVKNAQGLEEQTYKYTAENKAKLNDEVNRLLSLYDEDKYEEALKQTAVLVNPYFAVEVPGDLSADEMQIFGNIVMATSPEDQPITIEDVKKAINGFVSDEAYKSIVNKLTQRDAVGAGNGAV